MTDSGGSGGSRSMLTDSEFTTATNTEMNRTSFMTGDSASLYEGRSRMSGNFDSTRDSDAARRTRSRRTGAGGPNVAGGPGNFPRASEI